MMKVIVANYRYFIAGGPEKYMFKFMDAARKRDIQVIPFSVQNPNNEFSEYNSFFAKPRAKQLMYINTKKNFFNCWGILRATIWNYDAEKRLRKLIRETKADVLYILHEINHLSPSIIRAAKKENIKVIHRISDFFMFCAKYDFLYGDEICEQCIHGDYSNAITKKCVKNSMIGTELRVTAMKLYRKIKIFEEVDTFVSTCEFSKNKLIEGGIPEKKIVCVPTFINAKEVTPCYEHDNYFLFLGRMDKQKGTIYAIKAMNILKDTDFVLKITGTITESEEDQIIWKYIVENKLEEKIVFTGFIHGDDLEKLIQRATCIVCPAIWYENMPNAILEAYSYGKPVVASRLGSLVDMVDDGETGFLFEAKNSSELAEKLKIFIENKEICYEMGKKARDKCVLEYNEDLHMNRLKEIFIR